MDSLTVVIASAADANYALPLAVMLQSAVGNLGLDRRLEAHIVDDGISASDREKLTTSLPARVTLNWIKRPRGEFSRLPNWGRMSLTTYHKLTLGEWVPTDIEKVIWLDPDILVLGDLARLWEKPFENHLVLAVQDAVVPQVSSRFGIAAYRELGLMPRAKYFNAGVMLIDLARWRSEAIGSRAFEYLQRYHDRVFFWDQEALNAALAEQWMPLDPRWNWNPVNDRLARGKPATNDPFVIHFSGNLKPWSYRSADAAASLYYRALDQTSWRGWRPSRSWRGAALAAYESSRLRARIYPLERLYLRLVRWRTRR